MSEAVDDGAGSGWPSVAILGPWMVCAPSLWFGGPIGVGALAVGIVPVVAGVVALRVRGDRTTGGRNLQILGVLYLVPAVAVIAGALLLM